MKLSQQFVREAIERGIEIGRERGFDLACAVVDGAGRTLGVLRHEDALYVTPEFALGKARMASAYRNNTGAFFTRLQKERPLYGATIASLDSEWGWFLAEGGAAINVEAGGGQECIGAYGVSGCFPAAVDQEICDEMVTWIKDNLPA